MSASWFLVSMYLIWIWRSKLIWSSDQSSATLWVLETCLIVGLLPLFIILITASLSSKTYNKASWRADWTFEGTQSIFFSTLIFLQILDFFQYQQVAPFWLKTESRFQKHKESGPTTPEQATRPISIQRPMKWFRILLNCVKLKFVSFTSYLWEQTYDFPKRTRLHLM